MVFRLFENNLQPIQKGFEKLDITAVHFLESAALPLESGIQGFGQDVLPQFQGRGLSRRTRDQQTSVNVYILPDESIVADFHYQVPADVTLQPDRSYRIAVTVITQPQTAAFIYVLQGAQFVNQISRREVVTAGLQNMITLLPSQPPNGEHYSRIQGAFSVSLPRVDNNDDSTMQVLTEILARLQLARTAAPSSPRLSPREPPIGPLQYRCPTRADMERECGICLTEFADDVNGGYVVETPCTKSKPNAQPHVYCQTCLEQWLKSRRQCPHCRQSLDPKYRLLPDGHPARRE
jgi:hypothetical protein